MTAVGTLQRLYLKRGHGEAGVEATALSCEAGVGIVGDVHANRLSPRQVLVTMTSELERLRIPPGALQENMVISCSRPELFRPGAALVTASGVEIRLTMFCEPCKRIAHIEKNLAKLIHRRGVLGVFETGGELRLGDKVELIADRYSALPESTYQKFLDFLPTIPQGRVVRYIDVAIAIGAPDSFIRALPGYIKRSIGQPLPFHRIVNARGELLNFIPDQARKLQAEGLIIRDRVVSDLTKYLWDGDYSSNAAMRVKPSCSAADSRTACTRLEDPQEKE
jgi:alkylated DNA nucleotide flippase Atl1